MRHIDLTGQRFGRLTVISEGDKTAGSGRSYPWLCICDCGRHTTVSSNSLRAKNTKSCGCLAKEKRLTNTLKHGHASDKKRSKVYIAWQNMIGRCHRPKYRNYHLWGGRGIAVCEKWRNSFEAFLKDVGLPPSEKHQIDRIDNNGNYEPNNVRWCTRAEQNRNKRTNNLITYKNKTQAFTDWVKETGIPHATLYARLYQLGWSVEKALSTPKRGRQWRKS